MSLDGRDLVQVTMSISWSCPASKTESITPGGARRLADGEEVAPWRTAITILSTGLSSWRRQSSTISKGTYPSAGVFRVYLYDDFTKPLPRDQARKVSGQIVVQTTDPATRATKDVASFPLVLAKSGGISKPGSARYRCRRNWPQR